MELKGRAERRERKCVNDVCKRECVFRGKEGGQGEENGEVEGVGREGWRKRGAIQTMNYSSCGWKGEKSSG